MSEAHPFAALLGEYQAECLPLAGEVVEREIGRAHV